MTTAGQEDLGASVHGFCAPAFERVRAALGQILVAGSEVGAALAVYIEGEAVVDLWAGHADAARTRAWDRDTIVNLYSIGKAVTAVCALRLAEAGSLDLDAPRAPTWPQPARVRALRSRRVAGVCRPRWPRGVRLRHESGAQWLAAQALRHLIDLVYAARR
jgi:CubicO group peptidase (beta-lactamase class C family)